MWYSFQEMTDISAQAVGNRQHKYVLWTQTEKKKKILQCTTDNNCYQNDCDHFSHVENVNAVFSFNVWCQFPYHRYKSSIQ